MSFGKNMDNVALRARTSEKYMCYDWYCPVVALAPWITEGKPRCAQPLSPAAGQSLVDVGGGGLYFLFARGGLARDS